MFRGTCNDSPHIASAVLHDIISRVGTTSQPIQHEIDKLKKLNEKVSARKAKLLLKEEQISEKLDDDRKAAMVSNLLVVLCGDRPAQPIVNTGTIYQ